MDCEEPADLLLSRLHEAQSLWLKRLGLVTFGGLYLTQFDNKFRGTHNQIACDTRHLGTIENNLAIACLISFSENSKARKLFEKTLSRTEMEIQRLDKLYDLFPNEQICEDFWTRIAGLSAQALRLGNLHLTSMEDHLKFMKSQQTIPGHELANITTQTRSQWQLFLHNRAPGVKANIDVHVGAHIVQILPQGALQILHQWLALYVDVGLKAFRIYADIELEDLMISRNSLFQERHFIRQNLMFELTPHYPPFDESGALELERLNQLYDNILAEPLDEGAFAVAQNCYILVERSAVDKAQMP